MKNMSRFLAGILVGVVLSVSTTAVASTLSVVGKRVDGEFPVTVNGSRLPVSAGVIEGTSYLPVRVLSDTLGLSVAFSEEEGIALTSVNQPNNAITSTPTVSPTPTKADILIGAEIESLKAEIELAKKAIETYQAKIRKEESLEKPDQQSLSTLKQIVSECESAIKSKEARIAELEGRN